jgi:uncharacterized protein (DUF1501 family)
LFLARSANVLADQSVRAKRGRILVVVQLDGGNDGLNTVVPYQDDDYRRHRPQLALAARDVLRLDDRVGLHPALRSLQRIHDDRHLAVVQSVGYPNPNRSHFDSMAIWHTARLDAARHTPGWLARSLERRRSGPGGDAPALHIGDALLPQALHGGQCQVPSLASLDQFRRRLGMPEGAALREQGDALDRIASREQGAAGSLLQFVERASALTYASSARLEDVARASSAGANYPDFGLARRLKLIAQLIKAGLQTSIYYTQLGGFDTHASQSNTHPGLLREVGDSLKALLEDLHRAGDASRVLVLVFSEFGRRLRENASGGTDHGTAAPVFLLGPAVNPGVHGPYPNLQNLVDGDPRHELDFRQIYATLLDRWLECPSEPILGERFAHVPVLRMPAQ